MKPLSVKLVEYNQAIDEVVNTFTIPEEAAGTRVVQTFPVPQLKPGVTQQRPIVRPRTGSAKGQADDADPRK